MKKRQVCICGNYQSGHSSPLCRICRCAAKGGSLHAFSMALESVYLFHKMVLGFGCCWLLYFDQQGAPRTTFQGKPVKVVRVFYQWYSGEALSSEDILDHHQIAECGNSKCINPAHVIKTDYRGNALSGNSPAAVNSRKTHCDRGHAFTENNTDVRNNRRECIQCRDLKSPKWQWSSPLQREIHLKDPRREIKCTA